MIIKLADLSARVERSTPAHVYYSYSYTSHSASRGLVSLVTVTNTGRVDDERRLIDVVQFVVCTASTRSMPVNTASGVYSLTVTGACRV